MSDQPTSGVRIIQRAELEALFQERFGTSNIAWSIQSGDDSAVGQGTWLNYFNPAPEDDNVIVGRQDQRFFQLRLRRRVEGYEQPVLFEEPKVPFPTNRRPRVVGYVRVFINPRGYVLTKSEKTLMGDTLMIHPTSISKDEDIPEDARLLGSSFFNSNPQRIEGTIECEILRKDFPDDEEGALKVREVAVLADDGRTLSLTAKIMATANA